MHKSRKYVIPSGVTIIGDSSFFRCTNLTSITIPDTVQVIKASAFNSCMGLTSIYIPESVTNMGNWDIVQASESQFYGCNPDLVIYCGSEAKPDGWWTYWNYYDDENTLNVKWGYTYEEYLDEINAE